jgi:hypothetical protein
MIYGKKEVFIRNDTNCVMSYTSWKNTLNDRKGLGQSDYQELNDLIGEKKLNCVLGKKKRKVKFTSVLVIVMKLL